MTHFKQYQTSKNDDGTINVHDLEIFKLGKHKGFSYDDGWAETAIANHGSLESVGYLPSVIIGHNDGKEEKPAKGFLSQLRKTGDTIIANLTHITPETFESLKKREFPHRSVEVNNQAHRFTALALLGGTTPFHKLPVMEFGGTEGCEVIEFADTDLAIQIDRDSKLSKIRDIFWRMMDALESIMRDGENSDPEKETEIKDVLEQGTAMLKSESDNYEDDPDKSKMKEGTMPQQITLTDEHLKLANQKFAEENGMTPDEVIAKLKKFQKESAQNAISGRKQQIKMFVDQLKDKYAVAPKIADEVIAPFLTALPLAQTVKFGEDEKDAYEAFEEVLTGIVTAAKAEELLVPFGEVTQYGYLGDPLDLNFADEGDPMEDRRKLDKKIAAYAEEHNINYADAALKVVK